MSAQEVEVDPAVLMDKVQNDFLWYCENCLTVPERRTMRPVPLVMKPAQKRLAKHMVGCLIHEEPIRVVILKARRHGISTLVQAFFFWQCSTRPYQHSLTIAHDTTTTKTLHKMTERYYRRLPRFCKPKVDTATRGQMLEFQNPTKRDDVLDVDPGLESSMQTTSLENAGAGSGILWLHLSEVARAPWQSEGGQEAMTTALQTVPNEPGTAVIKESTAQGAGNSFHMDWLQAENGESDYLAFFAPWWEEPTYVSKVPHDFERTSEEDAIADVARSSRHCPAELSDTQLQWRRVTIANECGGKLDVFKQEYPSTPREAFLTSGRPFFDPESVERHYEHTEMGKPIHIGELVTKINQGEHIATFEPTRYGNLRIWEEPEEDVEYLIFSDCAAGTSDDGDFQAAYVMRRDEMVIVAAWHGMVDRDLFGENLCRLGWIYNAALIAVEVTAGWGASVISVLRKNEYPHIYRRRGASDKRDRRRMQNYGWETTAKTRAEMLDALEQALRDDDLTCNDPQLLEECRTFVYHNGKPQAQQGCHDDRVMAASGAVFLWLYERTRTARPKAVESQPWKPLSLTAGY